ncbi:hypothetical protein HRM2_47930 [Desulforapulum autotrophicum HRM2]|uniref:Uncharacterized protein n=1 Tax=Desulforapulum autotrophicum (strain ATCC 43914 / DSM 3382 / VKM B-1955 / HRM2) TaxID=177437 RepID=C0QHI3_DESAH|nr:hypothetical protein HRM2_47930 [Desulforapulum autotrophicum HRM2]
MNKFLFIYCDHELKPISDSLQAHFQEYTGSRLQILSIIKKLRECHKLAQGWGPGYQIKKTINFVQRIIPMRATGYTVAYAVEA